MRFTSLLLIGPLTLAAGASRADTPVPSLVRVQSPDGRVRIEFFLGHQEGEAVPYYRVFLKDQPILGPSRLTIDLADGTGLGGPCEVTTVATRSIRDEYTQFPGKRRAVVGHASEATVGLREKAKPNRRWELVLRAYNDGVAFRYRFPAQDGWKSLALAGERTEFALPDDTLGHLQPLNSFTTSYEKLYQKKLIKDVPREWLLGMPLLVECPGRGWAAITEANLTEYAGMYLTPAGKEGALLTSRLSPLPQEPKVAVKAALPHASPWRVVLLAEDAGRLIESDLVLHLNEPCALSDTAWIKPGKTTFPWWNGFYEKNVPFQPGLNTATMKHYIDFCAQAGLPYHSLDGIDNTGWYGCQIIPHKPADPTRAVAGIDLPEVLRHAKDKGVRLRLWLHWRDIKDHMKRAFPLYRSWGIEGVMLDFMDRDDQEMIRFLRQVLELAAENHLTVTLHGMSKPTGLERTYPNLLTSEGVLNLEYNKWDKVGCPPDHQVTVAFTRMLAGPLDFHQGSFRGVSVEEFKPRDKAPLVMGTPARTLASYVVYQNHLAMAADFPSAYRGHPGLQMLAQIPASWHDTKFLAGSVGEYVVLARRDGADWYVGAMNGLTARNIEVPLRFLGPGRYRAEILADDPQHKTSHRLIRRTQDVASGNTLSVQLESAGGYVARLTPLPRQQGREFHRRANERTGVLVPSGP
jgi:alpha-glucosidase